MRPIRNHLALAACVLVAFPLLALAQSPEVARDPENVECGRNETIGQCHARLGCHPNEELDHCQKRLLRCRPHETLEECKRRLARERRESAERRRERDSYQEERRDDEGERRSHSSHGYQAYRTFGLGIELGEPTGVNAKLFLTHKAALDFGLGLIYDDYYYGNGVHLYADFLYHPVSFVNNSTLSLPFYFGVGLRFWNFTYCVGGVCDFGGQAFGVRVPIGISFTFHRAPLDLFIQVVPVVDFLFGNYYYYYGDRAHFAVDGSIGLRYWF